MFSDAFNESVIQDVRTELKKKYFNSFIRNILLCENKILLHFFEE